MMKLLVLMVSIYFLCIRSDFIKKADDIRLCGAPLIKYKNDNKILKLFPFNVPVDQPEDKTEITKTFGKTDANGNIYRLNIANEKVVPFLVFCLEHLQQLSVRNTPFYKFDFQDGDQFKLFTQSLTELHIYDTEMSRLPEWITMLTHLETLILSNTGLMTLPDTIDGLSSLTTLYLPANKLTSLPTSIKNLRLLKQITLINNPYLRSIEPLNGLPALSFLDARNCSIEDLPRDLPQLTDLYMSNNKLIDLIGIRSLGHDESSKKSFYFHKNHIEFIPFQIQFVKNLYYLNLNYNNLTYLPSEIYNINTLLYLYIADNHFTYNTLKSIANKFKIKNPNLELCLINKKNPLTKTLQIESRCIR